MPDSVISDTSCLILFDKIGQLHLLRQTYSSLIITPEVYQEFNQPVPDWIQLKAVENKVRQQQFENLVDKGEASAIVLALELKHSLLILDDKKGRQLAQNLEIEITGTLGVLLLAKRNGIIPAIKPLLEQLMAIDYRISPKIVSGVLRRAGE